MGVGTVVFPATTTTRLTWHKIAGANPPVPVGIDANASSFGSTLVLYAYVVNTDFELVPDAGVKFHFVPDPFDADEGLVNTSGGFSSITVTPPDDQDYWLMVARG